MVQWLAGTIAGEAMRESLDEGKIKSELLDLQQSLDAGEVSEEDYDRQERGLLERLNAIRRTKSEQGIGPGDGF